MGITFDWKKYKSKIPECSKNNVRIFKKEWSIGTHTYLEENGHIWMSDEYTDIMTAQMFAVEATGKILITGLGLGIYLDIIKDMPKVKSVTILEKNTDVIDLVIPHFPGTDVIVGDAWEYVPNKKYDYIWHDFDYGITTLDGQNKIMERYEKYGKKQNCWLRNFLKAGIDLHDPNIVDFVTPATGLKTYSWILPKV